jgi:mannose-6-phosphate isomerase
MRAQREGAGVNELGQARGWAREWLLDAALPLWWQSGADRECGGFYDRLDQHARAVDGPKRLRVQARQAFVYAEAGKLGWDGPWRDAVMHGLDFMQTAYRREDGLFRSAVTRDGAPHVETPDLYDQAFVLFGWASAYAALGRPAMLLERAEALLDTLEALWAHPERGFEEANPRRLPLRSNPHMHMLEALLAWVEVGGGARFERQARAIVGLALERLIDPQTGAIGEYYDGDWRFAPGSDGGLREPGHQFEWAFLLHRAGRALGGDHREASERLYRFGERHGIHGGCAIFSTDEVGGVVDGSARLWAQTERLRTMLTFADAMPEGEGEAAALECIATLRRYLDVPVKGLWRDRIDADGTLLDEPAPASSFYHIMTGFLPLLDPVRSPA